MNRNAISDKQMGLWTAAAVAAPAVHTAAASSWLTVLIIGSACLLACYLLGRETVRLPVWVETVQSLWAGLAAGEILGWIGNYWPNQGIGVVGSLVLLILAAWSVESDAEQGARIGCMLFWPLVLLLGGVLLSGLQEVRLENIKPEWKMTDGSLAAILLIPALGGNRCAGKNKFLLPGILLLSLAASVIAMGVLSPEAEIATPMYELSRSLSLLGVSERFESLAAAGMTLGYFATLSYLLGTRRCCAEKRGWRWMPVIAAGGIYLLGAPISSMIIALGSIGLWILVPAICCMFRHGKKGKKGLDKW